MGGNFEKKKKLGGLEKPENGNREGEYKLKFLGLQSVAKREWKEFAYRGGIGELKRR